MILNNFFIAQHQKLISHPPEGLTRYTVTIHSYNWMWPNRTQYYRIAQVYELRSTKSNCTVRIYLGHENRYNQSVWSQKFAQWAFVCVLSTPTKRGSVIRPEIQVHSLAFLVNKDVKFPPWRILVCQNTIFSTVTHFIIMIDFYRWNSWPNFSGHAHWLVGRSCTWNAFKVFEALVWGHWRIRNFIFILHI